MYQNRLRDLREDRDLKQKDIAQLLQIHQTTYSDYELDRLNIPVPVLHVLADFYHVSVDYLLGLTNDERTVENFKQEDSKELTDFLRDQAILFNGVQLDEYDKQRVMDILSGLFFAEWNRIKK